MNPTWTALALWLPLGIVLPYQDPPEPEIRVGESLRGEVTDSSQEVLTDALLELDLEFPARGVQVLFTAEESGPYTIELHSHFFDSYLVLWSASGELLAEDDDGWLRTHSRIVLDAVLSGGKFWIDVAALHGARGPFELVVRKGRPEEYSSTERWEREIEDLRLSVAARERRLGPNHRDTVLSLNELGILLYRRGRYAESSRALQRALALSEVARELNPAELEGVRERLGTAFLAEGRFPEAQLLFEQSLAFHESERGADHLDTASSLHNLALVMSKQGNYATARSLAERAVQIRDAALGPDHPSTLQSVDTLAVILDHQGLSAEARPLLERALAGRERTWGREHPETAASLCNLAAAFASEGLFAEAQVRYTEALSIFEATLGPMHPNTAVVLNNLALTLKRRGDFGAARELYERALAAREAALGPDHPETAQSMGNLASLLHDQGHYDRARALYEQALEISEALSADSLETALYSSNLGTLLLDQGAHDEARALLERALVIRGEVLGPDHPATGQSFSNMGLLFRGLGRHDEARSYFEQALAILEAGRGANHPDTGTALNNLGNSLYQLGRSAEADPLLARALVISEATRGPDHPFTATVLINYALARLAEGNSGDETRRLLERALAIHEAALGRSHPMTCSLYFTLSSVEAQQGDRARAVHYSLRHLAGWRDLLQFQLLALSERERFLWSSDWSLALSQLLRLSAAPEGLLGAGSCYAEVLEFKGMVSRGLLEDRGWHQSRAHPEVLELQNRLSQVVSLLSRAFAASEVKGSLDALRAERDGLERQIASHRRPLGAEPLSPAEVGAHLRVGEALIDLVLYQGDEGSRLSAFVVVPGQEVVRVELGAAEGILGPLRDHLTMVRSADLVGERQGRALREALWEPLAPWVESAERIFVCPDGALAALPWETIPSAQPGSYLIEQHAFVYLESPHALATLDGEPSSSGALIVGGIDFDRAADPGEVGGASTLPDASSLSAAELRGMELHWSSLSGTAAEAQALATCFEVAHPGESTVLLMGGRGTESAFKAFAGGKRILHLATHGYFAAEHLTSRRDEAFELARDGREHLGEEPRQQLAGWYPGLLSGVVLAGANQLSSGRGEDGVLTAEEVLWLNLRSCELVTLSACETGLGAVKAGEHLMGLRRAFHLAGARSTITSLWRVNDAATRELMLNFYDRLWQRGESKSEALRHSQLAMLQRNRSVLGKDSPKTWAAFVLEGGVR